MSNKNMDKLNQDLVDWNAKNGGSIEELRQGIVDGETQRRKPVEWKPGTFCKCPNCLDSQTRLNVPSNPRGNSPQ